MDRLFVPSVKVGPHWFFRQRVVDRLYGLGAIGCLANDIVLALIIFGCTALLILY